MMIARGAFNLIGQDDWDSSTGKLAAGRDIHVVAKQKLSDNGGPMWSVCRREFAPPRSWSLMPDKHPATCPTCLEIVEAERQALGRLDNMTVPV